MDHGAFDRLTRLLAGGATRRAGLRAMLGAMIGAPAIGSAVIDAEAANHARDRAEVISEKKPCGPTARDNRCKKHKDCCTNYCKKPKKGGAKTGRCRCIKSGKKCKDGQTCCGGATCEDRKCTPSGPTCGAAGGACASDASCCTGLICKNGSCAPCSADVCASGCQYTTVAAAYAAAQPGGAIYIGSGTYPTGIKITKDITLAACPGVTDAKLVPDRLVKDPSDSYYSILTEESGGTDVYEVTLRNLTLEGTADGVTNGDEALLNSYSEGRVNWTVQQTTVTGAKIGIYISKGDLAISDSDFDGDSYAIYWYELPGASTLTMTNTVIQNSSSSGYAVYLYNFAQDQSFTGQLTGCTFRNNADSCIYCDTLNISDVPAERALTTLSITDCSFENNVEDAFYINGGVITITDSTFTGNGETAINIYDADVTINGSTISGNTGSYNNFAQRTEAGGIYVANNSANVRLTLGPGTTITTNTATIGAGLLYDVESPYAITFAGVNSTTIFGNNGPNCTNDSGVSPVDVPNCAV